MTARSTWNGTSSRCWRSSSRRRIRCCARRRIRPRGWSNAVSAPGVHILGHPRGRMIGSRPGVSADWDQVFAAAARANVAIEIDGDPSRQDLDYDLARQAVDAGCLFALDSDAHSSGELAITRKPRSRTRDSPAFRPIASSIAGRSSGCSNGRPRAGVVRRSRGGDCSAPLSTVAAALQRCPSHSDRPVISR